MGGAGGVYRARGARACELLLLGHVRDLLASAAQNPQLLSLPVRLVVPSNSLREHIGAALLAHIGRSVAGLTVHTLHGLALHVLERAGEAAPTGAALFGILVRQAAANEPILRRALHDLQDGYAAVLGSVADLLDAGFDPVQVDALEEALAASGAPPATVARARAIVRVAARTAAEMAAQQIGRPATVLARAQEILERDSLGALSARAVLIYGFADATGIATDLIGSLVRRCGASVYLDRPPAVGLGGRGDAGEEFTRRFTECVVGTATIDSGIEVEPTARRITLLRAPGLHAEARGVAERVRALLDAGNRPERIGVVARSLAGYVIPIRLHFSRLGIPFSGSGARGGVTAFGRRVQALREVLRRRHAVPVDRWVEALGDRYPSGDHMAVAARALIWRAHLRLALHTLGAPRLENVAALDASRIAGDTGAVSRPFSEETTAQGESAALPRYPRSLSSLLRCSVATAHALHEAWERWPAHAGFRVHLEHLFSVLESSFGWDRSAPDVGELAAVLDSWSRDLPAAFSLTYAEFILLLDAALADIGTADLGGGGAGVQVMDVTAARARTFDHVFLVGVNRDVFPRPVAEDPLFPDALRLQVSQVLPDIPIKRTGFDEDRYLFAQLLTGSPEVTISWSFVDDEGKPRCVSPLVEQLRLARPDLDVEALPPLFAHRPALRSAYEQAVVAGVHGRRRDFDSLLPLALAETYAQRSPPAAPEALARVRLAVLAERDAAWRPAAGAGPELGPYDGFVGSAQGAADPRQKPPFITLVESLAVCPWRTLLTRVLKIRPRVDVLEALPAIDPRLLGTFVHRVLHRIARHHMPNPPADVEQARRHPAVRVPWPDPIVLDRLLHREAEALIRAEGIPLPEIGHFLVEQARPYLAEAQRSDWPTPDTVVDVLAAEVDGRVTVEDLAGHPRAICFTADRIDAVGGGMRLTDYKTGRLRIGQATDTGRRRGFLDAVHKGELLQCVAYALAAGGPGDAGRYLYLSSIPADVCRVISTAATDTELRAVFAATVRVLLDAWDRGSLFPRFAEPNGGTFAACRSCEVAEACLRNDSQFRSRILRWLATNRSEPAAGAARPPHERALLRLWNLRDRPHSGPEEVDSRE